jgi:hypothetical protein
MKNTTLAIIAASTLAVVVIGFCADTYVRARVQVAVANERVKAAEASLVEGQKINERLEAALELSRQEQAVNQAAFLVALEKIKASTPAQIVSQGAQMIGADDIVLSPDEKAVTMGVETYRKFVIAVAERDEYVKVKEPAWNAREALYQQRDAQNKLDVANYVSIIKDLRIVISKQKTTTLMGKLAWAGGGFAAGFLASKIK